MQSVLEFQTETNTVLKLPFKILTLITNSEGFYHTVPCKETIHPAVQVTGCKSPYILNLGTRYSYSNTLFRCVISAVLYIQLRRGLYASQNTTKLWCFYYYTDNTFQPWQWAIFRSQDIYLRILYSVIYKRRYNKL